MSARRFFRLFMEMLGQASLTVSLGPVSVSLSPPPEREASELRRRVEGREKEGQA